MESLIKDTMACHLSNNKLIRNSQHGFMANRSCGTNLLVYLERASKAVDSGKSLDMVYLDFAKAFDLVPKKRLIEKLKAHGYGGKLLSWIEAWLTDRKQRVVLNGKSSNWIPALSGVPQGSILGPLLFTIFINDLDEGIVADILLKFADDTKVGKIITGPQDRVILQESLDQLCNWADTWGMRFNVDKCHILHMGRNNPRYSYQMYGKDISVSTEERDIGVIVADNLKAGKQCEKAARTATTALMQILKTFSYRDKKVLPQIYKQYVRPHLDFAVQAWAPWQHSDIEMLEKVQKKMVSNVMGLESANYEEKLTEIGLTTLADRRIRLDMIQTYKIIHGHDDVCREEWFKLVPQDRAHMTRRAEGGLTLEATMSKTEARRNFFSQRVVNHWNNIPLEVRAAKTVREFVNSYDRLRRPIRLTQT